MLTIWFKRLVVSFVFACILFEVAFYNITFAIATIVAFLCVFMLVYCMFCVGMCVYYALKQRTRFSTTLIWIQERKNENTQSC